jgi:ferredoxin
VTLNKETFYANVGDVLLDGAIMSGVELQHDCRSGICGSCRVRLVDSKVFGGTEEGSDMIYACQARVVSDMKIVTEPVPETVSMSARVAEVVRLAPDVVGVCPSLMTRLAGLFDGSPRKNAERLRGHVTAATGWLGREGSNLRMAESKSAALPLGYAPTGPSGGSRRCARRGFPIAPVYRES